MVRTRRGKVQGDQSDQSESPVPLQSTRAAKHRRARKSAASTASSTNGIAAASPVPPARARRLRSDKSAASPLQTLEAPPRRRPGRAQKETPAVTAGEDDDAYEEEDTGIFFQESFRQTKSELQLQLNGHRNRKQTPQKEIDDEPTTPLPGLSGEELLERIESEKRLFTQNTLTSKTNTPGSADAQTDDATPTQTNGGNVREDTSTPARNSTAQNHTPRTTGWGFRSIIDRIIPSVFRSATPSPALVAPPATAPPRPLNADEIQELNESLVPADTPTRKPAAKPSRTKPKKSKGASSRRIIPSQRAIISRIANNVKPEQKSNAVEWAKKQTETLAAQGSIGEKRKMLDEPLKLKDIKSIPSSLPWQTGSYGLVDDFFDDSDEETDAPEWYKLDQLANAPPAKRQKVEKESETVAVTPKKKEVSSVGVISGLPLETPPRPATTPSPMFNNPATPPSSGNIFEQSNFQSSSDKSIVPNSFSIPDDFSDEEEEPAGTSSSPWTQAPPPAPAPAHASLPKPITATPSVPAMSDETFFPQADPVKDARKEAMKYTPAKPSGLRNVMSQSPLSSGGKPLTNGTTSLFGNLLQAQSLLPKPQPPEKAQPSVSNDQLDSVAHVPARDNLFTGDAELAKHIGGNFRSADGQFQFDSTTNPYTSLSLDDIFIFQGDNALMDLAGRAAKSVGGKAWLKDIGNSYANIAKAVVV